VALLQRWCQGKNNKLKLAIKGYFCSTKAVREREGGRERERKQRKNKGRKPKAKFL